MFLNEWMILAIALSFGACAWLNYKAGKRDGVQDGLILGIDGTFSYLEKHNVISFLKDGSIKGAKGKIGIESLRDIAKG